MATKKSKFVVSLQNQISTLVDQNAAAASATLDSGRGRDWMLGDYFSSGWTGDTTDIEGMTKAFNRSQVIDVVNDVMNDSDPGTAADKIAMRFQNDYISAIDRAFRTRHSNAVRSEIFAAQRRRYLADAILKEATEAQFYRIVGRV